MTQVETASLAFEQYLANDDGLEGRHEITRGELVEVPPENDDNITLATELYEIFKAVVDRRLIRTHASTLEVEPLPGVDKRNRYPDLMVLTPELTALLKGKSSAVKLDMPSPALVVEIVSAYRTHEEENYQRDYHDKRQQYEARGIPEYWIVDPTAQQVSILVLIDDTYQTSIFQGSQLLRSSAFPELAVTADSVLA